MLRSDVEAWAGPVRVGWGSADGISNPSPEAGPLAQLAEQRTFNPRVVGSSPTGLTIVAGQGVDVPVSEGRRYGLCMVFIRGLGHLVHRLQDGGTPVWVILRPK